MNKLTEKNRPDGKCCLFCNTRTFHYLEGQAPYELLKDGSILCWPCSHLRRVKNKTINERITI